MECKTQAMTYVDKHYDENRITEEGCGCTECLRYLDFQNKKQYKPSIITKILTTLFVKGNL